jgi:hypothetical protein
MIQLTDVQACNAYMAIYIVKTKVKNRVERHRQLNAEPETIADYERVLNHLNDLVMALGPQINEELKSHYTQYIEAELERGEIFNQLTK